MFGQKFESIISKGQECIILIASEINMQTQFFHISFLSNIFKMITCGSLNRIDHQFFFLMLYIPFCRPRYSLSNVIEQLRFCLIMREKRFILELDRSMLEQKNIRNNDIFVIAEQFLDDSFSFSSLYRDIDETNLCRKFHDYRLRFSRVIVYTTGWTH